MYNPPPVCPPSLPPPGLLLIKFFLFYGMSVGLLWVICGLSVGYLWVICGILMGFLWVICGILMGLLWVICGIVVGYLWDSCGITLLLHKPYLSLLPISEVPYKSTLLYYSTYKYLRYNTKKARLKSIYLGISFGGARLKSIYNRSKS